MSKQHIVLAEDETYARHTLALIFRKAGYKVTAAADGKEALDFLSTTNLETTPVDLLITDIQMPHLTGTELIDSLSKANMNIPILVITGFGDKELVIELMRKGCSDFIEKPFEPEELLRRVDLVLKKYEKQQQEIKEELSHLEKTNNRMTREMETYRYNLRDLYKQFDSAVDAYRNIIDIDTNTCHVRVAYQFKPLSRLGGDFFDIRNTLQGCDIFVADVAGHDMGASYHAVLLKSFFEDVSNRSQTGADFFRLLNRHLIKNGKLERMVTAAFLRINLKKMAAGIVAAGHPPVLMIDHKHEHIDILPAFDTNGSRVLGIFEEAEYHNRNFSIQHGDRFILYTDGVIDAFRVEPETGEKTKMNIQRLIRQLNENKHKQLDDMIKSVWDHILDFCRYKPNDDMLLLGVEIP